MALIESRINIGQELIAKTDNVPKLFTNIRTKPPRFTHFASKVSMGSEKGQESSNLISPNNEFIIRRIVQESWNIKTNERNSTDAGLK